MDKEKAVKIASIVVGVLIAAVLVWIGFRVVSRGRADFTLQPSQVKVTDITCNSAEVSLTIPEAELSDIDPGSVFLRYTTGDAPPPGDYTMLNLISTLQRDEGGLSTTLTLLPAGGTTYFIIDVNGTVYNNSGSAFTLTTLATCDEAATTSATPAPTAAAAAPTTVPAATSAPTSNVNCATDCVKIGTGEIEKDAYFSPGGPCKAQQYAACMQQNSTD